MRPCRRRLRLWDEQQLSSAERTTESARYSSGFHRPFFHRRSNPHLFRHKCAEGDDVSRPAILLYFPIRLFPSLLPPVSPFSSLPANNLSLLFRCSLFLASRVDQTMPERRQTESTACTEGEKRDGGKRAEKRGLDEWDQVSSVKKEPLYGSIWP